MDESERRLPGIAIHANLWLEKVISKLNNAAKRSRESREPIMHTIATHLSTNCSDKRYFTRIYIHIICITQAHIHTNTCETHKFILPADCDVSKGNCFKSQTGHTQGNPTDRHIVSSSLLAQKCLRWWGWSTDICNILTLSVDCSLQRKCYKQQFKYGSRLDIWWDRHKRTLSADCDVPKKMGMNASQMMQVVYMVNPMGLASLKVSGTLRVLMA